MKTSGNRSSAADTARRRLPSAFYRRPALEVAPDLLGRVLCRRVAPRRVLRGRIVEVEAYDGLDDQASHARRGRTARNAPMFEPGGSAYVYLIYGMHHCLNVVTGERDHPAAILIRATEPPAPGERSAGPGLVCRAFEIDRELDGVSLLGRVLWIEAGEPPPRSALGRTPRIGVDYAGGCAARPYRFVIRGNRQLSGPRRLRSVERSVD